MHGCRTRFATQCRESNSHLRCLNTIARALCIRHHFAGHDMQRLAENAALCPAPETAHHFLRAYICCPGAAERNLRCAAEFHAQGKKTATEFSDAMCLDRKFFLPSPQRADEISKAAESDCAGRVGRCRSAHNESGRRCQLQRRGQMQEHFGSAQGHSLRGYGQVQRAEIKF